MIDKEGYRENVAIVIINNDHKVLWAKRANENAWQFPQGGIKSNETIDPYQKKKSIKVTFFKIFPSIGALFE